MLLCHLLVRHPLTLAKPNKDLIRKEEGEMICQLWTGVLQGRESLAGVLAGEGVFQGGASYGRGLGRWVLAGEGGIAGVC